MKRLQDLELPDDELEVLRRYRLEKRLRRDERPPSNPAVAVKLSIDERPFWAKLNAPAACTSLGQLAKVVNAILFGVMDADGNNRRLEPCSVLALLMIAAVKFKFVRVVGTTDADNLGELLGYSARRMRDALRELEDAQLIVIEREFGRISKVWLANALMTLPKRLGEREELSTPYPQGRSNSERRALSRQNSAALLSKRAEPDNNPLPPSAAAPPPAPAWPPRPPRTDEEEALRTAPHNGAAPAPVATAAGAPDGHGSSPQAAAVAPSNGDKRPRQPRGAHSLELAPPGRPPAVPRWWRQLLERARIRGPAPPE